MKVGCRKWWCRVTRREKMLFRGSFRLLSKKGRIRGESGGNEAIVLGKRECVAFCWRAVWVK